MPNLYLVKTDTVGVSTNFVGIGEEEIVKPQSGRLSVYPNPANENVNCTLTLTNADDVRLVIYNSLGEIVSDNNIQANQFNVLHSATVQINTSALASGIYYCSVLSNNGTLNSERLIIAR